MSVNNRFQLFYHDLQLTLLGRWLPIDSLKLLLLLFMLVLKRFQFSLNRLPLKRIRLRLS